MPNQRMEWHGDAVIASVNNAKPQALEQAAQLVSTTAKAIVPRRTGKLADSIAYVIEGEEAKVGSDARYARFVEMGTRNMSARPYLRPSIDQNKGTIEQLIGRTIGSAAEAGGRK